MPMFAAIRSAWPLLLGLAILMLGNGLQGTLLGVRATLEGFSTQTTGYVMTGYYVGFLLGSFIGPKLVKNVGHIRVFAALASILSAAMLLHAVFVEPVTWFAIRVVNGFAIAGLYVVVESWLNDTATNRTRGQLLSVYMVIVLGGMAAGQFLLNLASPAGFELFILISVLVSVSLVPIALSVTRAPKFEAPVHVGWRTMYQTSPLGVVGCLIVGIAQGGLIGMGAVYAREIGMSVADVSLFMATALGGGVVLQWPVGRLSDIFDRRVIITVVTLLAALAALIGALVGEHSTPILLLSVFLFGGLSFPCIPCVSPTPTIICNRIRWSPPAAPWCWWPASAPAWDRPSPRPACPWRARPDSSGLWPGARGHRRVRPVPNDPPRSPSGRRADGLSIHAGPLDPHGGQHHPSRRSRSPRQGRGPPEPLVTDPAPAADAIDPRNGLRSNAPTTVGIRPITFGPGTLSRCSGANP